MITTKKKEIIKKLMVKGRGGPGDVPTQPVDPSSGGIMNNPVVNNNISYATNGPHQGATVDQDFGTQQQTPIDPNPKNLPRNLTQNALQSKGDLSPVPPENRSHPQTFLPGKSRVKAKGSETSAVVKKMLSRMNNYKKSN